jgi:hypothetical protein
MQACAFWHTLIGRTEGPSQLPLKLANDVAKHSKDAKTAIEADAASENAILELDIARLLCVAI